MFEGFKHVQIQTSDAEVSNIVAADPMNCGHYMQEEMPDLIYDHFTKFFV